MALEFKNNLSSFETQSQSRDIFETVLGLETTCEALGHSLTDVRIRETNRSLKVGKYTIALGKSLRKSNWKETAEVIKKNVNSISVGEMEGDSGFLLIAYLPSKGGNQASHALFSVEEEEAADSHAVDADAVAS